jgi:hypothetical protein
MISLLRESVDADYYKLLVIKVKEGNRELKVITSYGRFYQARQDGI